MAKNIEKIIEDSVVPEMEYVKTKQKVAEREVPEVVLPKTKAEMYREAKGRLDQKTKAVSSAYNSKKKGGRQTKKQTTQSPVKTAEIESAATSDYPTTVTKTADRIKTQDRTVTYERTILGGLRRIVEEPKWVGSADELVPFAWRNPLMQDISKPNKNYKAVARDGRSSMLPAPRDK